MHWHVKNGWKLDRCGQQNRWGKYPPNLQVLPTFDIWFVGAVHDERALGVIYDFAWVVAQGLTSQPLCYKRMYACGSMFRTRDCDITMKSTCDSVVTTTFQQQSVASRGDQNHVGDTLSYVGYITNIISLTYGYRVQVLLLRVQW